MKALIATLLFALSTMVQAAPVQPSDLAVDDNGDMDVFVLCALSGSCVDTVPLVAFMTVGSNITPTQAEIDIADKIPLNFDPFTLQPLPGDEIRVARTGLGFAYEAEGVTLTPDEWVQMLVFDGNQWLADFAMTQTGPDSFVLDFPTQDQLLIVDAVSDGAIITPIPATALLLGTGLIGLAGVARRT